MSQPLTNAGLARCLNVLAAFLGMRDVGSLTRPALLDATGAPQADVMALFGGSILAGGDVLADAIILTYASAYVNHEMRYSTTPARTRSTASSPR